MKREFIDDTVLLPILQYILKLFQSCSHDEAFRELESYQEQFHNNKLLIIPTPKRCVVL